MIYSEVLLKYFKEVMEELDPAVYIRNKNAKGDAFYLMILECIALSIFIPYTYSRIQILP